MHITLIIAFYNTHVPLNYFVWLLLPRFYKFSIFVIMYYPLLELSKSSTSLKQDLKDKS